ncbi:DNA translocase FtsK [Thermosulfuriphilus sp.]
MAKAQRRETIKQELLALLGLAAAFFVLTALVTYHHDDPSLSSYTSAPAQNAMGLMGAYLAGALFDLLGLAAFLVPLGLLWGSLGYFRWAEVDRLFVLGGLLFLISASFLLELVNPGPERLILSRYPPGGGLLGVLAQKILGPLLGQAGFVFFSVLGLFVGWLLMSGLSPSSLIGAASGGLTRLFGLFKRPPQGVSRTKTAPVREDDSRIAGSPSPEPTIREPETSRLIVEDFSPSPEVFSGPFTPPSLELLDAPGTPVGREARESLLARARILEEKLADFGVSGRVKEVCPGPVITVYEFEPAPGVKINRVTGLADDLALALKAESVRVVGPIPGKSVVGIEVANPQREIVHLKEIIASEAFRKSSSRLTIALGKDISGHPVVADLAKMPHLLIAGATGTGKSVCLNAMIISLIYKSTPQMLRFLMIDPKRIELSIYDGIPYLLHPVVIEPKNATRALRWAVQEMERRYLLLEEAGARNLDSYNVEAEEKLPYVVIIIDELADLMLVSSKEVEEALTRLAQMARAAGIHLLVATQRPSVDILTGIIKANFPARISFQVSSKTDSRTILDTGGAERLLGAGDMLFLPPGTSRLERIHGAYVSEKEVKRVVEFLKSQGPPEYEEAILTSVNVPEGSEDDEGLFEDEKYEEAVDIVLKTGQASISMLQRRLRIGYNRAARLIERMEKEGIVGPADGVKPRPVFGRRDH